MYVSVLFIHCFLDFSTFSFTYFSIFNCSVSLFSRIVVKSFSVTISVDLFWMCHNFLFLFMTCNFFVEHWTFEFNNVVTLEFRHFSFPRAAALLLFLFLINWFIVVAGINLRSSQLFSEPVTLLRHSQSLSYFPYICIYFDCFSL